MLSQFAINVTLEHHRRRVSVGTASHTFTTGFPGYFRDRRVTGGILNRWVTPCVPGLLSRAKSSA